MVNSPVPEEVEPAQTLPLPVQPAVPEPKKDTIEDREYKDYKVGGFTTISEGKENLLEISNCDCPASQLGVRIEKQGSQVVFQRTVLTGGQKKQQVQRFTMPYVISSDRITAKFEPQKDGGKLTLHFRKPAGGASSVATTSGEFTKFVVAAVAGSEGKVTMKPSQEKDRFIFEPTGEPKLETEIIGEIEGGDIKFHAITKDLQAGVSKKATQSFSLGTPISVGQIDVENGGKRVLVYPKRQVTAPTSAAADTVPSDIDVTIQVI